MIPAGKRIIIMAYTKERSEKNMGNQAGKKTLNIIVSLLSIMSLVAIIVALIIVNGTKIKNGAITVNTNAVSLVDSEEAALEEELKRQEEALEQEKVQLIEDADRLAASYDYDGAITLIESFENYEEDSRFTDKIAEYEGIKATCVPVKISEVTHIFYHSLVVDPERAFANQEKNPQAVGNNQWMTTISEFEKITQEMYDRGYVMVSIHDLYEEKKKKN